MHAHTASTQPRLLRAACRQHASPAAGPTCVNERRAADRRHLSMHNGDCPPVGHPQVVSQAAHKPAARQHGSRAYRSYTPHTAKEEARRECCISHQLAGRQKASQTARHSTSQTSSHSRPANLVGSSPPSSELRPSCAADKAALRPARSIESRPDSVRGLTCSKWGGGSEARHSTARGIEQQLE